MTTRRLILALMTIFAVAVGVAACGGDDPETVEAGSGDTTTTGGDPASTTTLATTTTTGEGAVAGEISLTIEVTGGAADRQGTLTCGEAGVEGTGYLAEANAAQAACDLLQTNEQAKKRLLNGRPDGMMCTQIYGGPDAATVIGSIDGQQVNQTITRSDGCGIAEWSLLQPLLGPPGS